MAVTLIEENDGRVLLLQVTDKLTKEDYALFVPDIERLIGLHGKVRLLVEMHDFQGWMAGALWADLKFDLRHFRDIERLALVGEKQWQKGMAAFCRPFITAKVRYYDHARKAQALTWLHEQLVAV